MYYICLLYGIGLSLEFIRSVIFVKWNCHFCQTIFISKCIPYCLIIFQLIVNGLQLKHSEINEIAENLKRTPAQVVLRWGIQRKTAIIPKSSRIEKLRENIALFDFELNADQMNKISGLNINTTSC